MNEFDINTILLSPRVIRQLSLEAENFEKCIKLGEKNGNVPKSELTMMWMDTVTKKDMIKGNSGITYEQPLEVTRNEKLALMRLFKDLAGFSWSRNFGWVGQGLAKGRLEIPVFEVSSSLYDGIVTKRVPETGEAIGNVYKLELGGVGCTGILPDSLSAFEECTFICMHWNLISGELPSRFGNLSQLTHLDLSGNALTGIIDAESLSQFSQLQTLNLSFNDFEGSIPDVFQHMPYLTCLNLSGNCLTGDLPNSIGCLTQLEELKLYNNQLSGIIPDSFSNLKSIVKVNLSRNKLSGGLSAFNRCGTLRSLELSNNLIRGRIDMSVMGLKKLEVLYLQHNRISGTIPPELCLLVRLQRLNLSNNYLRGVLPHNIGELINLESLLLGGNSITGPVPRSIAQLMKLKDFYVFRSYPAEISMQPVAFNRACFERIYEFGPTVGINSVNWDFQQVYGRERDETDNDSVTLFSGLL